MLSFGAGLLGSIMAQAKIPTSECYSLSNSLRTAEDPNLMVQHYALSLLSVRKLLLHKRIFK